MAETAGIEVEGVSRKYVWLSVLLGAGLSALAWAWGVDYPPPEVWEDAAVAAGLRPPAAPFPLLWHALTRPLFNAVGVGSTLKVLRLLGPVSLGVLAVLVSGLLAQFVPDSLRTGLRRIGWWRALVRFMLFQCTVFCCCSDPVWRVCRFFTPQTLDLLLIALGVLLFMMFMRYGGVAKAYSAFAIFGLLSADTPVGFVFAISFAVYFAVALWKGKAVNGLENDFARLVVARRMSIAFILGLVAGAFVNASFFAAAGGREAFGWTPFLQAAHTMRLAILAVGDAATVQGWALIISVVVVPFLVEIQMVKSAVDSERFMPFLYGVVFAILGLVAFSQLSGAKVFWFWTWCEPKVIVANGLLLCVCVFVCTLSVLYALSTFTMEIYFRNFRSIALRRFPDATEDDPIGAAALASLRKVRKVCQAAFFIEPVLALAAVLPFRVQTLERAMLDVIGDAVRQTAEECRDVRWLFTDGGLDASVELAAAAQGHKVTALSMMSRDSKRETRMRTRDVPDKESFGLLKSGAADALRIWLRSKSPNIASSAIQIGFELWQRDQLPTPPCAGFTARPAGFPEGIAESGGETAREIAKRVLALYEEDDPDDIPDVQLRDAFLFVQWRLAVIARHRGNASDNRGDAELALEEARLSDELDRNNGALDRIRSLMAWAGRKRLERLTPREGLRVGLDRADFTLARVFAQQVLRIDPDDPSANFAMGMDYFVQKHYTRAEVYLKRCLVRRPDDPAVLNNLAQCQLRQGRLDEAEENALRAKAFLPDSREIKGTIDRINKVRAKRGK